MFAQVVCLLTKTSPKVGGGTRQSTQFKKPGGNCPSAPLPPSHSVRGQCRGQKTTQTKCKFRAAATDRHEFFVALVTCYNYRPKWVSSHQLKSSFDKIERYKYFKTTRDRVEVVKNPRGFEVVDIDDFFHGFLEQNKFIGLSSNKKK